MNQFTLHHGDCLEALKAMPDHSVDSIVTDPPYGLTTNKNGGTGVASVNLESPYGRARIGTGNGAGGFMGHKWDSDVPSVEIWTECLRVLKPGGYLLAFAGTRTQHRMAVRIEDAGFEIRDMIAWVYGSGFPKSHNGPWGGTALKPALEPITVARKPLVGTVAANVLAHGTGALNIDGCRVEHVTVDGGSLATNPHLREHINGGNGGNIIAHEDERRVVTPHDAGRWPANLIHDGSDEVVGAFPANAPSGGVTHQPKRSGFAGFKAGRDDGTNVQRAPDTGSAARFFYCAKASKRDRGEGNSHPTVKPTDLMRYLCRLVTPPGGVVLDPFMGSGSTGKAAVLEGFRFVGCELSADYLAIARHRIEHALALSAPQAGEQMSLLVAEEVRQRQGEPA